MKVPIMCPYCGWNGRANSEDIGGTADCPQCRKDFVLQPKPSFRNSSPPIQKASQSRLNPRIEYQQIPQKIKDVLWIDEAPVYASRPAHRALVLKGLLAVIFFFLGIQGIIGYADIIYSMIWVVVVLPLLLMFCFFSWKNQYYIITPERTIVSQGVFNVTIRIVLNRHIQFISVNTGLLDRCIGLNTIEVFTAANVIGNSVLAGLSGLFSGGVQLKSVNVKDVIGCYDVLRHPRTMDEDNTDTVLGKEKR